MIRPFTGQRWEWIAILLWNSISSALSVFLTQVKKCLSIMYWIEILHCSTKSFYILLILSMIYYISAVLIAESYSWTSRGAYQRCSRRTARNCDRTNWFSWTNFKERLRSPSTDCKAAYFRKIGRQQQNFYARPCRFRSARQPGPLEQQKNLLPGTEESWMHA